MQDIDLFLAAASLHSNTASIRASSAKLQRFSDAHLLFLLLSVV